MIDVFAHYYPQDYPEPEAIARAHRVPHPYRACQRTGGDPSAVGAEGDRGHFATVTVQDGKLFLGDGIPDSNSSIERSGENSVAVPSGVG